MQTLTDEQLAERLRVDEGRAFEQLYLRYKHRVYAYCYRLLRHPQNAEDATQETFLKVHRSLHQLEKSGSLVAWIFSIARNEAFTILRRIRPAEGLDVEDSSIWDDENPFDRMVEKERAEIVKHCLSQLNPTYRELLILREYEQLSYAEIAQITGGTESAVKSGLFKSRRAIRKRLESILEEREEQ